MSEVTQFPPELFTHSVKITHRKRLRSTIFL